MLTFRALALRLTVYSYLLSSINGSLISDRQKLSQKKLQQELEKVLPSIIHHNQTGYVNDRFIGETDRFLI